jgi:hypothetical protein
MARAAVSLISNTNSAELRRRQANAALGWLDSIAPNEGAALPAVDPDLDGRVFVLSPPGEIYAQIAGAWVLVGQPLIPGAIDGLIMSTGGSSATLTVGAGAAASSVGARLIKLASALSKTTSAWAVGNNQGGLLSSSIANNTWYHFQLMERLDTGVVDVGFSTSFTPTLPTGYTLSRYIGSAKTNGSAQWIRFFQIGEIFLWETPVRDVAGVAATTTCSLQTLPSVPPGVSVEAIVNVSAADATQRTAGLVHSANMNAQTPGTPAGNYNLISSGAGQTAVVADRFVTDTSQRIYVGADATSVSVNVITQGYVNHRGRL